MVATSSSDEVRLTSDQWMLVATRSADKFQVTHFRGPFEPNHESRIPAPLVATKLTVRS
jgi:hypothetical protein